MKSLPQLFVYVIIGCFLSPFFAFSQTYMGVKGAYFETNDFDGWGGGVHVGRELKGLDLPESVRLGLEIECLFIDSDASKCESVIAPVDPLPGTQLFYNTKNRKVDVKQFPIFLNARLSGDFCKSWPINWYVGGGLGIQYFEAKEHRTSMLYNVDHATNEILDLVDLTVLSAETQKAFATIDTKHRDWLFAGQLFGGLTVYINPHFSVNTGVKFLVSENKTWSDANKVVKAKVSFGQIQVGYELGINYQF